MPFCTDIFYRQYNGVKEGVGFPVLLIHGGGGTHMGWPSDLRRLPDQNVIAIDLPGHGLSKLPACLTLDGLLERLTGFISCMGFYQVILIGFSLGGALALTFTHRYPLRVKKLALISCGDRFVVPDGIMRHLRPPADTVKAAEIFSQAAFHPKMTPAFRRKIIEPLHGINPAILAADFHIGRNFRAPAPEKKHKNPLLVIGGTDDQITPPQSLRLLTSFSDNSHVELIPAAGHMVIYEKTRQVRDLLVEFLKN